MKCKVEHALGTILDWMMGQSLVKEVIPLSKELINEKEQTMGAGGLGENVLGMRNI